MGIHFSVSKDLKEKIIEFGSNRKGSSGNGMNMSEVLRYSLNKVFEQEQLDPMQDNVIKEVLDRRFVLPRHHLHRAFLDNIALNAKSNPKGSAKEHWGDVIYISSIDKTHAEIAKEILDEMRHLLQKNALKHEAASKK